MTEDRLVAEMRALRDRVAGITGSALASRDGLIIKADTDLNVDNLAALAAASLGLAQRMAREVGQGLLRDAVTRNSGGYVAIYAVGATAVLRPGWALLLGYVALYSVGDTAVLILTGNEDLKVGRLHSESRETIASIEALLGLTAESTDAYRAAAR